MNYTETIEFVLFVLFYCKLCIDNTQLHFDMTNKQNVIV